MGRTLTFLLPVAAAFTGAVLVLFLTPWMAATARRIGLVDRPDGGLKRQEEPVPYLGGLAVFISFLVPFALFSSLDRPLLAVLLGATLLLTLGLLDDMGRLSPWVKLAGQALAAATALKAGVAIQVTFLPPPLAYLLSFLWLVGMTNAMNLIDIMDGLAAGVGAVACLFLGLAAVTAGQGEEALLAGCLLGSLAGFLRWNVRPARIYLGDAGSLPLGFLLGCLALSGVWARHHAVSLLAPLLILAVPLFDTLFVSLLRIRRGQSPLQGSPDHFPLRLRKWRLTVAQTVGASWAAAAVLGAAGMAMVFIPPGPALLILGGVGAALLAAAAWLRAIDMDM